MRLKRLLAVLHARNTEFVRDREALGWNFLFPVLVVLGFGFAFSSENREVFKVGVLGPAEGGPLAAFLGTEHLKFVRFEKAEEPLAKLRRHQLDLLVDTGASPPRYWVSSSSPNGYLLERILKAAGGGVARREAVEGREIRYVDWLISGLLGMNMMFSALFGVGYTIVRYRKNGYLKRLKATPLSSLEFLLAQVASRLLLLVFVTAIVYAGCNALIHFQMLGSYVDLALVLVLGMVCLISLGLLVASRSSSEELAGGILNLVSWPMMFLSGVWFSLEGSHPFVRKAAQAFPLTHVIDASRAIMTEGATLAQVAPHVAVLVAMSALFLLLGALAFRWE